MSSAIYNQLKTRSRTVTRRLYAAFGIAMASLMAVSTVVSGPAFADPAADISVESLQTNSLVNPLGISTEDAVVFSWKNDSTGRNVSQTAYEVEVAGTAGDLASGNADMWASGKITSTEQLNVQYDGAAIASQSDYFWRVRTWNNSGQASAWSEPATFETTLAPGEWDADWVGGQDEASRLAQWSDYTVSVDFTLNQDAMGVYFRARDAANGYMWQINTAGATPLFRPHRKVGGNFALIEEKPLPAQFTNEILNTGTHNLTITAVGNTITTFLDGVQIAVNTESTYAQGYVGFRQHATESATIHKVTVTNSDSEVLLDTDFASGANPFTGGELLQGGQGGLLATNTEFQYRAESSKPLLRTEFDVDKTVVSARLYASARGVYKAFVNGERVGNEELAPGWTDYNKRIQFQTYDVTDQVKSGDNALGVMLADGWYSGYIASFGPKKWGSINSFIAQMRIDYSDGTSQWVKTGADWKTTTGPLIESDMIMGERYDATLERVGWNASGYDATGWGQVGIAATAPNDLLVPQTDEPVRVTEALTPIERTENPAGVWIYDMGQNMVGVPSMEISGKAGQTIKFRHGEVLNPDGSLYTANLRSAKATDYYTFAQDGTVTYTPQFTFHGFRFLEISGIDSPPELDQIKGLVWGTDLERTGYLETSSSLLNQLQSNIVWGQRGNFLSIPTDTPARDERLGWTGDINVFAPTASRNQGTLAFLSKWLVDLQDSQAADGNLPGVAPFGSCCGGGTGWSDAAITVPYSQWLAYGDLGVISDNYSMMTRFMDKVESDGGASLIRDTGGYGDWLHLDDNTSGALLGTAYYAYDARLLSEMAAALGKTADAARYEQLAVDVKAAFVAKFIAEDGTVLGNSQTGYAMAIGMGLVPDDRLAAVGARFVAKVASKDYHLSTGFLGTPWLLPALSKAGYQDVAYRLLQNEDYPSWGYEIANGATTIWERWNSIMPDGSFGDVNMNSFNHYAYGAVGDWMYQNIGGITPTTAGYKTFDVAIQEEKGGLDSGKASFESVYGTITTNWTDRDGQVNLNVQVPVSTTATVRIPALNAQSVTEGGVALSALDDIEIISTDNGEVVVKVGSGIYAFSSDPANSGMTANITGEGDILPGTTVTGKLVVKNTSSQEITEFVANLTTADGSPVTINPTPIYLNGLAAGASKELPFTAQVPIGTPAGKIEVFAEIEAVVNGQVYQFPIKGQIANVLPTLAVVVDSVSVLEGDPGPAAIVTATAKNTAKLPVQGHFEVVTPAGWKTPAQSRELRIPAGGTGLAEVYVPIPLTVTADNQKVEVRFVSTGRTLGKASGSVAVTLKDPPEVARVIDSVDFGESTSETAHAVANSGNGGTTVEAGRTRRYSGLTKAGTWFSAKVKVPADGAFIIRGVETFDQQQVKSYDIFINDILVNSRLYERTETGTGLKTFQVLVDGDILESLKAASWDPSSVTVKFMYNAKGSHDPSLADIWILSSAADSVDAAAPTVGIEVTKPGQNGWNLAGSKVVLTASDLGSGVKVIEYSTDGTTWQEYLAPVELGQGATTLQYRATDNAGNVSGAQSKKVLNDAAAPTVGIEVTKPGQNGWNLAGSKVVLTASDLGSGVKVIEYSTDGTTWQEYLAPVELGQGTTTLQYRATDKAGNVSAAQSKKILSDTVAPVVSIALSKPETNGTYPVGTNATVTAVDSGSGVATIECSLDGGTTWSACGKSVAFVMGDNVLSYRVTDKAGNVSKVASKTVKIQNDVPAVTLKVQRFAGVDRYETSLKLAQQNMVAGKPLFVASGAVFADSLAVGSAVYKEGGTLLLTPSGSMSPEMLKLIETRKPSKIYVIGGTQAVSGAVVGQLEKAAGIKIQRVSGEDRYATSVKILTTFYLEDKNFNSSRILISSGSDFPDALTASSASGAMATPLLIVNGQNAKQIPTTLMATLVSRGMNQAVVIGGESTVNKSVVSVLSGAGLKVERSSGTDRYATSIAVNKLVDSAIGSKPDTIWLASGANFPDALSAAPLAGNPGNRLYLVQATCLPAEVLNTVIKGTGSAVKLVNLVGGLKTLDQKNVETLTGVCK